MTQQAAKTNDWRERAKDMLEAILADIGTGNAIYYTYVRRSSTSKDIRFFVIHDGQIIGITNWIGGATSYRCLDVKGEWVIRVKGSDAEDVVAELGRVFHNDWKAFKAERM